MKKMIDKTESIGIAGELFVAAELTRQGFVASLTGKNTKAIDILASNKDGSRSVAIQVKTCDNSKENRWKMSVSSEKVFSDNLFYVLVNIKGTQMPDYFIVPSKVVAERIKSDYEQWISTPGKKGQQRNETTMRIFTFNDDIPENKYRDAWNMLGL